MRAHGSTIKETEMAKVQERVKMAPKSNNNQKKPEILGKTRAVVVGVGSLLKPS